MDLHTNTPIPEPRTWREGRQTESDTATNLLPDEWPRIVYVVVSKLE